MKGLLGRKLGMTQIFGEDGERIPVTVIEGGPCSVLAIKTRERDGYDAVQLGFEEVVKEKVLSKPKLGYFKKIGVSPKRYVREIPLMKGEYQVGQSLDVDLFTKGDYVSVMGMTIGKGFQGGVKRWHWRGGRATRGSMHHRAPGSIGSSTTPGRVWKGHHLPGQMGQARRTIENLEVVEVDRESHLLLVKGSVPGKRGYVIVSSSKKKTHKVERKPTPQVVEAEVKKKEEKPKPAAKPKKEGQK